MVAYFGITLHAVKPFWQAPTRLWPGTVPTKRASAFITFPGSVRCWQPLWSRALQTPEPSDQDVTSRLGLGSFQSSTQDRLGSISKQSDHYLRSLFVAGLRAMGIRDKPAAPASP